jgi:acyl dehydratase
MRYFEDFVVGTSEPYGTLTIDEDEMLAFAGEFDPQPMHLDATSEQARRMGGVLASGWFTASANMRLMADHFIVKSAGMGSPGVSSLKWLQPVRAGDRLTGTMTILDRKPSSSKPDRGFVSFRFDLVNQAGKPVLEQENLIMYARREPAAPVDTLPSAIARPAEESFSVVVTAKRYDFIDDIRPGSILRYGTYTFTPENMIRFARRFDPQAFHLSEEAGKASHFGGLSASGWHTASAWMHTVIRYWQARDAEVPLTKRGPGFGFTDLVWRKPVLAGDTLTYFSRVVEARRSASRPGWGILTQRNYALNQHGIPVFAFTGAVLMEART